MLSSSAQQRTEHVHTQEREQQARAALQQELKQHGEALVDVRAKHERLTEEKRGLEGRLNDVQASHRATSASLSAQTEKHRRFVRSNDSTRRQLLSVMQSKLRGMSDVTNSLRSAMQFELQQAQFELASALDKVPFRHARAMQALATSLEQRHASRLNAKDGDATAQLRRKEEECAAKVAAAEQARAHAEEEWKRALEEERQRGEQERQQLSAQAGERAEKDAADWKARVDEARRHELEAMAALEAVRNELRDTQNQLRRVADERLLAQQKVEQLSEALRAHQSEVKRIQDEFVRMRSEAVADKQRSDEIGKQERARIDELTAALVRGSVLVL